MSNTTYPTTLDSPTNPTAANPTTSPAHHLQHGLENDAIVALETALGVTAAPGPLHYDIKSWFTGPGAGTAGVCLGETVPRQALAATNQTITTSGDLVLQALYLPKGVTITKLGWMAGATAASTPTHCWMGLYDNALNQLATTADTTTTAIAANSVHQYAIAQIASGAAASFVTTYSGLYYLGIMISATTVPTCFSNANLAAITALFQVVPILNGLSDTGQTTPPAFPHQAQALSTALSFVPYMWAE